MKNAIFGALLLMSGCSGSHWPVIWGVNDGPVRVDGVKYDSNPQYSSYSVIVDLTPQNAPQPLPSFTEDDARMLAQWRATDVTTVTAHAD